MELTRTDGTPPRVLVVDDEENLAELISMALRYEGFEVATAHTGTAAVLRARELRPDAVVLDMMLPDFDGLEVLRRLRALDSGVPVVFLTARDAVEDRVAGLTAGGDDYVTKPFSLEEVVARLRALMRRAGALAATTSSVLTVGDLSLDEDSHEVFRAGEEVTLTVTEFELLRFLMLNPAAGAEQGPHPRPGLALRLRRAGQRRRALHLLPAQEDRRRPRADDPHHARSRLRPEAGLSDVVGRPGRRWPRTLLSRLVVTSVALVVLSAAVIGVLATLLTRSYLLDRLDDDVRASLARVTQGPPPGVMTDPSGSPQTPPVDGDGDADAGRSGREDSFRGAAPGTLTASVDADGTVDGTVLVQEQGDVFPRALSAEALAELARLAADGTPREVHLDGLGSYDVAAGPVSGGSTVVVAGLPLDGVEAVTGRLVAVELVLVLGVAVAAVAASTLLVGRQLRPLREVAGTAREVAALPLASGEIDLAPRVPDRLADERTEVGRVGSALNTLLAHVESSLDARHRSEQQVRQFVADASHELRTPLATIAGYAELARRRPDDDVALRTALSKVEEESGRMTALVEDLLLLARLDSGRPLERRPVDLTRLLVEAVTDVQVVAPEHRWRLDVPETPVELEGDAQRLHQVVTNLLTNARKYTPSGHGGDGARPPGRLQRARRRARIRTRGGRPGLRALRAR